MRASEWMSAIALAQCIHTHTHTNHSSFFVSSLSIEYFVIALNKFSKSIDFQFYRVSVLCVSARANFWMKIQVINYTLKSDLTKEFFWLIFLTSIFVHCTQRLFFRCFRPFFIRSCLLFLLFIESIYSFFPNSRLLEWSSV